MVIQQGENIEVLVRKQGISMAGKASSEIANLYCYAIEAQMVSDLTGQYGEPAARKFANVMRYIISNMLMQEAEENVAEGTPATRVQRQGNYNTEILRASLQHRPVVLKQGESHQDE